MTGLIYILECCTIVVTFLVIASGLPACMTMYKTGSTKGVPYILFLVYAFVSTLSVQYGLLIENTTLILINTVALIVWVGYISVYFLITKHKTNAFLKASVILFMYWAHLQYLTMSSSNKVLPTLGFYLIFWCTVLALLPCSDIVNMIKSKSSASCDVIMLSATTVSAITWILFGGLLKDINIWFPAAVGLIVNVTKFALIFAYTDSKKSVKSDETLSTKKTTNGQKKEISTDFHEHVYRIRSRSNLRKGIQ